MEIREIEAFFVLAEELHFGRAAERLGLSPGRVSQLLAALERRLGRRLMVRSSRAVELSAAGEQFLAEAGAGYRQLERAIAATRAAARRKAGLLRLGTSVWLDPTAGADLAEAFEHRHPGRRADRVIVRPADLFSPLTEGDVDVLILPIPGPPESLPSLPGIEIGPVLTQHARTLFVAADHPLAGRAVVTAADVAGHQLARLCNRLPAWWSDGYLPAAWSGTGDGDDPAPRASEPRDAFDLVVRRRVAFLASAGTGDLFPGADVIAIPVSGLPPLCTVLASRAEPRDRLTAAFLAMAAEFAATASHAQVR